MTRRGPARKARHGQIETAPEEMHRARLAEKAGAKMTHDLVRGRENAKEATCVFGIVGLVNVVLVERDGTRNFTGHRIDLEEKAELTQRHSHLGVERRNRYRPHYNPADIAVAHAEPHHVLDEVELYFQAAAFAGHRRGRQPPCRDVKRTVPCGFEPWRQQKPDLAYDLCPKMQGVARGPPGRQWQLRPAIRC